MKQKEAGFTLVELTVAILMIALVVGLVTSMFTMIRTTQRRTVRTETATRAAQLEMESLRNNSYSSLTAGQTIDFTSKLPAVLPRANGVVTVSEPNTELKRIDVSVSYYEGDQQQVVKISSLVGILGITQ